MHYNDHADLSNVYSELVVIFPLRMPEIHLIGDEVTAGGASSTPTASGSGQFGAKSSGCGGMNPGYGNTPWLVTTSVRWMVDDLGGERPALPDPCRTQQEAGGTGCRGGDLPEIPRTRSAAAWR